MDRVKNTLRAEVLCVCRRVIHEGSTIISGYFLSWHVKHYQMELVWESFCMECLFILCVIMTRVLSSFSSAAMWQTAFISCLSDLTCILPANLSLLAVFQHSRGGGSSIQ